MWEAQQVAMAASVAGLKRVVLVDTEDSDLYALSVGECDRAMIEQDTVVGHRQRMLLR